MVFDDVDRPANRPKNFQTKSEIEGAAFIASPIDRLAAFMADLVIFLPLVTLAIAPLKKQALLAQIAGEDQKLILLAFAGAAMVGGLLIAYHTFFIGTFGTTPGKHFVGLRVVNIWTKQRPTYFAAFVRSAFWVLSLCTLGLPWLAIFSNSHRRPLHDRVADTLNVVRDRSRAAASPSVMESSMINGLNAAVITFVLLIASIFVQSYVHQNKDIAEALVSEKVDSSQRCEQVTSAVGEWLGTEKENPNRMEVALALHAGDRIDDDCLDAEATTNFLEEKYLDLSYLAKALLKRDNDEEFADYMDKVCEADEQTPECELLEDIQSTAPKAIQVSDQSPTYFKIWAVKLNLERGFAQEALAILSTPAPHMDLAYFFANKRLQAKLDLKFERDINSDFISALDGLNREERISLARETCLLETQLGCGNQFACNKLLDFASAFKGESELSFENPTTVLALSRAVRCENKPELFDKFASAVELPAGQLLIQSEKLLSENKKSSAVKMLKSLAKQNDFEDIKSEAVALLVESGAQADLESVSNQWSEVEHTSPTYRYLGWALHKAYFDKKDFNRAFEVGQLLKNSGLNSSELQKNLVIAAYESHQTDEARDLLAEFDRSNVETSELRAPASAKDDHDSHFEAIAQLLRSSASREKGKPQ